MNAARWLPVPSDIASGRHLLVFSKHTSFLLRGYGGKMPLYIMLFFSLLLGGLGSLREMPVL